MGHIDRHQPEVRLIERVEKLALRVEGEIASKAVRVAIPIEVESPLARFIGRIEDSNATGVAFRTVECVLAVKGESHEDAAPGFGILRIVPLHHNHVTNQTAAALITVQ